MPKRIGAALSAALMTCLAVPLSTAAAQTGISTNPAPLEKSDYIGAVQALSQYEVDSSRLALKRSQASASRSFAQEMVEYHVRVTAKHANRLGSADPPSTGHALVGPLSEMLNSLENTTPAEFDTAYKRGQIAALEEAVKVHTAYAAQGSDAATRREAPAAMQAAQKHLDRARNLPGN